MKEINILIRKADVYNEVAKTTAYTGAKAEDASAYDRISSTDADREMLEGCWVECCNDVTAMLGPYLVSASVQETGGAVDVSADYSATAKVSDWFDDNAVPALNSALSGYFTAMITGKWFLMSDKEDAEMRIKEAAGLLVKAAAVFNSRRRPQKYVLL